MPPWQRPHMDPRIRNLPSTTFGGERLSRHEIVEIQETVQFFPALSRSELVRTVCVQMDWHTPGGAPRLGFGLRVLRELQRCGIVRLPPKRGPGRGPQKPLQFDDRTAPRPPLREPLARLAPVRLETASGPEQAALWNQWVGRHHPQGYRQPLGAHLRYWVRDGRGRLLGCLLFDRATRRLPCRDRCIGWEGQAFHERLHLVVRNARYLLFPWVQVENLASHVLGLAARQLPGDWERWHGWRPVLLETYVNPRRHQAACYRAANWQLAGRTQARGARGKAPAKRPKEVYLLPLHPHWKRILLQGPRPPPPAPPEADEDFLDMWREILGSVARTAAAHDRRWQRRRRSIGTLLVVLFVLRLARTPGRQGYARVLADLWECCRRLGLQLPQPRPVAASSMCAARAKVGVAVFRRIHAAVLRHAGPDRSTLWKGLRAFAVDGSKLNLPRELVREGYSPPSPQAHYPQGLLSCLYQIGRRLPCDFALHAHGDERRAALQHLTTIGRGDLVVYDRGYYSWTLLQAHRERQVEAVFRLKRNASRLVREFVAGDSCDELVSVEPTETARRRQPGADLPPCRLRLAKYVIDGTVYALGTTLLDAELHPLADLADLYHGRWSVEELYKVSKELLEIEGFHSRSERTVKQELYAHFTLVAMARLFASHCERQFESRAGAAGRLPLRANFNHSLGAVEREMEALLLHQAPQLRDTLNRVLEHAARSPQRERPGRSYPRRSRRPSKKWRNRKPADPQTAD